jgi:hypothetical protein
VTGETTGDVGELLEQLKALPLIDGANLDRPGAAYDAFELVLSPILRAALVQVPEGQRRDANGRLFKRFVIERFPPGHGGGNVSYADELWQLRNAFVKDKQTRGFGLTHNSPGSHWRLTEAGHPTLDLGSLIADYREAVDNLGELLRASPTLRGVARAELEKRTVVTVPMSGIAQTSPSLTGTALRAPAASGTSSPS